MRILQVSALSEVLVHFTDSNSVYKSFNGRCSARFDSVQIRQDSSFGCWVLEERALVGQLGWK